MAQASAVDAAIAHDPATPAEAQAARDALHLFETSPYLVARNTLSGALARLPTLGDAALRQEIYAVYEGSSYALIAQQQPGFRGRCDRAAAYAAFLETFPDGPHAAEARDRAAACSR